MENNHTGLFDLQVIMRQGDLNIRRVAAAKPDMTIGVYFDLLQEMLDQAPLLLGDLEMLLSRDSDRYTFKRLAGMVTLLADLGYNKDLVIFDSLLDAYDRGYSRLTARYAKKIMESFDLLITRVTEARITELPDPDTSDTCPEKTTLREWISLQFKEERSSKPVIFAIDDSPVILKSVSSLLSSEYKVYMLANPVLLEKTLEHIKPDMFLLDYNMPDINGFELVPIIRRYSAHKDTPIIFLTSEGTVANLTTAIRLGACDFIVKPVQPNVLFEKIAKHITKQSDITKAS